MESRINGSSLKKIAMITMFMDHFAAVYLFKVIDAERLWQDSYIKLMLQPETCLYCICRLIGRIAFPLYLFLLAEGVTHTKNIKKYLLRLFAFAVISEIPFDLAINSRKQMIFGLFEFSYQNIFVTLLLAVFMMQCFKIIENRFAEPFFRYGLSGIVLVLFCFAAYFVKCDYGYSGMVAAAMIYLFRNERWLAYVMAVLALSIMSSYTEVAALAATGLIVKYNGQRGKQKNGYFYYAFYPVHLLLLWLLCVWNGYVL